MTSVLCSSGGGSGGKGTGGAGAGGFAAGGEGCFSPCMISLNCEVVTVSTGTDSVASSNFGVAAKPKTIAPSNAACNAPETKRPRFFESSLKRAALSARRAR